MSYIIKYSMIFFMKDKLLNPPSTPLINVPLAFPCEDVKCLFAYDIQLNLIFVIAGWQLTTSQQKTAKH